ncbi:hypothetical protein PSGK_02555 [Pseudomonas solani]|uniref:hypothetical protein n=1 Tax=Pseudomonas solani TaxID=2731552 RepID=UPI0035BE1FF2
MDENPYAAPQTDLVGAQAPHELPDWSPGLLNLLGWLCLISALGSVAVLVFIFLGDFIGIHSASLVADWLGLAVMLLGSYLSLRLKGFAEARFAATGLAWPTWLVILAGVVSQVMMMLVEDAAMARLGWQLGAYLGLMVAYGAVVIWLAVRLLKVQNVYPPFRVMAWLLLVGGVMMATVLLVLVSVLPLLGSSIAMALVFFRGARDVAGRA